AEAVAAVSDRALAAQDAFARCGSLDVHAAAETAASSRDDDGANAAVLVGAADGVDPFGQHFVIERVKALGLVQGDSGDAVLDVVENALVVHQVFLLGGDWDSTGGGGSGRVPA